MTLEHWTANMGNYYLSDRSEVVDEVTPAYGRLIAGGGCVRNPRAIVDPARSVAASSWFIEGCDLAEFRDPPDGPWLLTALLGALDSHREAFEWLGAVLQYIGWAFLDSLSPITSA